MFIYFKKLRINSRIIKFDKWLKTNKQKKMNGIKKQKKVILVFLPLKISKRKNKSSVFVRARGVVPLSTAKLGGDKPEEGRSFLYEHTASTPMTDSG